MADVEMQAAEEAAEQQTDLSSQEVITKYREASTIAQQALDGVLMVVQAGKRAVEICELGDTLIEKLVAPLYKKAKVDKGIAFPTCISVNGVIAHYSPLESEDKVVLAAGDVVKM
jgi:methionine aminopeptidase